MTAAKKPTAPTKQPAPRTTTRAKAPVQRTTTAAPPVATAVAKRTANGRTRPAAAAPTLPAPTAGPPAQPAVPRDRHSPSPTGPPAPVAPPAEMMPGSGFNLVHVCPFRSGWVAWLAGESQSKATLRTIAEINAAGRKVAACAPDRWSIWKRLLWALVLVVTLGIKGRSPGVLLISEPR